MKEKDIEAIIASIVDDKHLVRHIYSIVKEHLSKNWRNDINWCNTVINYAIEQTLEELNLINLVSDIKKKVVTKKKRQRNGYSIHQQQLQQSIFSNQNSLKSTEINLNQSKRFINSSSNLNNNQEEEEQEQEERNSYEVKPIFSSTEPVQITTSPGRRHKNYAETAGIQTIPSSKRNPRLGKLGGKLSSTPPELPSIVESPTRSIFGEDSKSNKNKKISNNNGSKNNDGNSVTISQILHENSSELITKSSRDSNDDQVLIQMSNEVDDDDDNEESEECEDDNQEGNENVSLQKSGSQTLKSNHIPSLSSSHNVIHTISVDIDSNDASERSHMRHFLKELDDIESNENQLNTETLEESFYGDDFEEISETDLKILPIATWAPNLNDYDDSQNTSFDKKVEFSNPVVTAVTERDKCSRDEISELFYTHDESVKFENDYAKELEKAEVLGLSWNDWIEKRTEEDIIHDETEEVVVVGEEHEHDSDVYDINDYDDEEFETDANINNRYVMENDDIYEF